MAAGSPREATLQPFSRPVINKAKGPDPNGTKLGRNSDAGGQVRSRLQVAEKRWIAGEKGQVLRNAFRCPVCISQRRLTLQRIRLSST